MDPMEDIHRPLASPVSSQSRALSPTAFDPVARYLSHGHGTSLPRRHLATTSSETTPLINNLPSIRYVPGPSSTSLSPSSSSSRPTTTHLHPPPPSLSESPLLLLLRDVKTFFTMFTYLPNIMIPTNAVPNDGLVKPQQTSRRTRDNWIIVIVSVVQLFVWLLAPLLILVLPGLVSLALGLLAWGARVLALWVVQGPRVVMSTDEDGLPKWGGKERWIFVNGVMTGYVDLQFAVDGLAQVFRRPIMGIHNRTSGFVGDIVECLLQRCLSYATSDVRAVYDAVRATLVDKEVEKVVLIGHSQGGLIVSLVLDQLLVEMGKEVGKLEIYTFGSAASYFHNPLLQRTGSTSYATPPPHPPFSQHQSSYVHPPSTSSSSASSTSTNSAIFPPKLFSSTFSNTNLMTPPASPRNAPFRPSTTNNAKSSKKTMRRRAVPHIEHYANSLDPIPRWGVLYSVYALSSPVYAGKVFVRLGASGHYFTSHYLAAWFPVDAEEREVVGQSKLGMEKGLRNGRMKWGDPIVNPNATAPALKWGNDKAAGLKLLDDVQRDREGVGEGGLEFVGIGGIVKDSSAGKNDGNNKKANGDENGEDDEEGDNGEDGRSIREVSRLWGYVDGRTPGG